MNAKNPMLHKPQIAVRYVDPKKLKPNPANPRTHKKRQLAALCKSVMAFGFNIPIAVDSNDMVVAGHARLEAALKLQLDRVPVISLAHLTSEQVKAYTIADNRLCDMSSWDEEILALQLKDLSVVDLNFDIEAIGFTVGEIDLKIESLDGPAQLVDLADEPVPEEDFVVTQLGDLWQLGEHRVYCGDATQATSYQTLLYGQQAAMVFTDPPYNVRIKGFVGGKGKVKHDEFAMASGEMSQNQFTEFLRSTFSHLKQHSALAAIHYLCMDWRHMGEMLSASAGLYHELKNLCVWAKDRAGMGSFYRSQHELVFVFQASPGKYRNNVELGRNGRHRSNVWQYPSILNQRKGEEGDLLALHPTVKPIRLVADAILDASARTDIVLDPFLGSGTTLMACQRTGRTCYGLELDPKYVDTIIRRWQHDTGQDAVLVSTGHTFTQLESRYLKAQEVNHG